MNLYENLKKMQRKIQKSNCVEYIEFNRFKPHLENFSNYESLIYQDDDFTYIKAYAIILSLLNKDEIENYTKEAKESSLIEKGKIDPTYIRNYVSNLIDKNELKYLTIDEKKYYVPIFGRALNFIYSSEQEKLIESPYDKLISNFKTSIIDIFEFYNLSLFDSSFTRLTPIKQYENVCAFYHSDFKTIYFINDQGRLETKIPIFDKYLHKIVTSHLFDRLTPVVDAYFSNDRDALYKALIDNKLVSYKAINKIKRKENNVFTKLYRK